MYVYTKRGLLVHFLSVYAKDTTARIHTRLQGICLHRATIRHGDHDQKAFAGRFTVSIPSKSLKFERFRKNKLLIKIFAGNMQTLI